MIRTLASAALTLVLLAMAPEAAFAADASVGEQVGNPVDEFVHAGELATLITCARGSAASIVYTFAL